MQPLETLPLARAQAALADHVRNPQLPAPEGIAPERLAVYTRLVRNNLSSFLDRCFSDSSTFVPPEQWQAWQNRFLTEARPESPFFNDIPAQFLQYLHTLPAHDRPSENILAMMDFETALLHAETALQPDSDGLWHEHSLLSWAPAARLRFYPCDFVGSGLQTIEETPCYVLSWRDRNNEVYYRTVADADLFLLQYFQEQSGTFTDLLHRLQMLLPEQEITGRLKETVNGWVEAGVLLAQETAEDKN